jgi:tripartite ATP-independent transporter DctP family solute receptor
MKRRFMVFLVILIALSCVFGQGTTEKEGKIGKPIEIKLAHENATDQPIHRYSQIFADKVEQYSEGRIKVTVYPAGQLGNMTDLTTNVSLGLMDMCVIDNSNLINYLPEYSLPSLPMMIQSFEQAERVFDSDMADALDEKLAAEHNIRILGWWWNGFRNMCSTRPIRSIQDFRGVKFRSPGLDNYLTMFELLKAKPTVIPWGETFSGFQTGIVDGMESTTEALYSQSFYTIGKYIILTRHLFSSNAPVMSESLWKSFSAADQALIRRAMDEATEALRKEVVQAEEQYIEKLRQAKAEIIELRDSDQLIDLFTPYWKEFAQKYDAQPFLDFIISSM